jgi:shikimate kinase
MGKRTQTVFLVGMPGSGKTTIGKKLAAKLEVPHLDLDAEIERKADAGIPEIFSTLGEAYFRQVEANTLRDLDLSECPVVSTGGGTPCFHENMDWMLQTGRVVYVKMPVKALHQRLMAKPHERPMFGGKTAKEQLQILEQLLQEREPFYLRSNHVISGLSVDIKSLASELD